MSDTQNYWVWLKAFVYKVFSMPSLLKYMDILSYEPFFSKKKVISDLLMFLKEWAITFS